MFPLFILHDALPIFTPACKSVCTRHRLLRMSGKEKTQANQTFCMDWVSDHLLTHCFCIGSSGQLSGQFQYVHKKDELKLSSFKLTLFKIYIYIFIIFKILKYCFSIFTSRVRPYTPCGCPLCNNGVLYIFWGHSTNMNQNSCPAIDLFKEMFLLWPQ